MNGSWKERVLVGVRGIRIQNMPQSRANCIKMLSEMGIGKKLIRKKKRKRGECRTKERKECPRGKLTLCYLKRRNFSQNRVQVKQTPGRKKKKGERPSRVYGERGVQPATDTSAKHNSMQKKSKKTSISEETGEIGVPPF